MCLAEVGVGWGLSVPTAGRKGMCPSWPAVPGVRDLRGSHSSQLTDWWEINAYCIATLWLSRSLVLWLWLTDTSGIHCWVTPASDPSSLIWKAGVVMISLLGLLCVWDGLLAAHMVVSTLLVWAVIKQATLEWGFSNHTTPSWAVEPT